MSNETCSGILTVTNDLDQTVRIECQEAPGFNAVDDEGKKFHLHRSTSEDTSQHVWRD